MEKEKPKKVEAHVVMCCTEREGAEIAEKIRKKVLLLGESLGGRSNVVMTRLNDDDLKHGYTTV